MCHKLRPKSVFLLQGRKRKKEAFLTDAEKEALQNYDMMKAARVRRNER